MSRRVDKVVSVPLQALTAAERVLLDGSASNAEAIASIVRIAIMIATETPWRPGSGVAYAQVHWDRINALRTVMNTHGVDIFALCKTVNAARGHQALPTPRNRKAKAQEHQQAAE